MNYVFTKPSVCEQYPAIGGGEAYDADTFAATVSTDHPAGGNVARADADVVVSSIGELDDNVPAGTTMWVESGEYDIGSRQWEFNNDGVTIASDGALLYTDSRVSNQFEINGNDCRIHGLRFRGPEPDSFGTDGYPASEAITITGARTEIDDCQFRGYTHAAVELKVRTSPDLTHIHHSEFCDNNSNHLGYGITVFHGEPLIRACYFDNNRHSVAGDGADDCGWTTLDCIGGEHHKLHAWDMHEDAQSSGDAGTKMVLKRNILLSTHNWYDKSGPSDYGQETVSLRGIPRRGFVVKYNIFANSKPTEPMRDHDNDSFNVMHATTFAEGRVEGTDLNEYGWEDGEIAEGLGPTRETAVTGYDSGGARDGSNDENLGQPPEDSNNMENPTSGKTGTYRVKVHGNGSTQSVYVLIGADGLTPIGNTMESSDSTAGRATLGKVSTISDSFDVTGPVEVFKNVGGDSGIELEVDGTRYPPSAFASEQQREEAPAGELTLGALNLDGATYDVAMEYHRR